jgi:predicted nucleotidyltransferase
MANTTAHHGIDIPHGAIADFCMRHHIRRLSFFGSILRLDFRPESDIDVLVDFEPEHTPGLALFGMQEELSKLFGRKVDMHTPASLSKYFQNEVLSTAKVQYDAA